MKQQLPAFTFLISRDVHAEDQICCILDDSLKSLVSGWLFHYSFRCQPVDYSYSPLALRMARGCWWYYFSKFTEFLDTIFFVLRKKNDHVSTLHVIHHGCMPMSVWFGVKFTPGGHSTFFGLLNTFVHIVMYFYYMLAAIGPQLQKYLWWKKYLTALQMIQFVLVMVHAFQLLFVDCNYPRAFVWWIGMHAVMFYFLFSDFYKQTYKKKAARAEAARLKANALAKAKLAEAISSEDSSSNLHQRNIKAQSSNDGGAFYEETEMGREMAEGFTTQTDRNRVYIGKRKTT